MHNKQYLNIMTLPLLLTVTGLNSFFKRSLRISKKVGDAILNISYSFC